MNDRQWKRLLRDIRKNRCILLLGPRIGGVEIDDGKWKPMMEAFSLDLSKELKEEEVPFNQDAAHKLSYIAHLFLGIPGVKKVDLQDEAKQFHVRHTHQIPPIYRKLANLPFTIVINTTFDNYMIRAFNHTGKLCYDHFYNFMEKDKAAINPDTDPQHPIVYNLFGSLTKPNSLVITDEDQVNFVKNVVQGNPSIPSEILEQFDQSKSYLFLGFDLEHWQFRLLLESLRMKEGSGTHTPRMENYPISDTTKAVFQNSYKFHFIEKSIDNFLDELILKLTTFEETETPIKPLKKIFLSYVERDQPYATDLIKFMQPIIDRGELEIKHQAQLLPGDDELEKTKSDMEDADALLLLLSADFLASEKIKEGTLKYAMQLQEDQKTTVIPIIARACDWKSNPFLSQFAALPMQGQPIVGSNWNHIEEAYENVIRSLKIRLW